MRRLLVLGVVATMLAACATKYSQEGFVGEGQAQGVTPAARADDVRDIVAAVRSQIFACWKPVNRSIVAVRIKLNQDGSLSGEPVVVNYGDSPSQAAAASALRAIRLCQPFKLPVAQYRFWQTIEINFVPQ